MLNFLFEVFQFDNGIGIFIFIYDVFLYLFEKICGFCFFVRGIIGCFA